MFRSACLLAPRRVCAAACAAVAIAILCAAPARAFDARGRYVGTAKNIAGRTFQVEARIRSQRERNGTIRFSGVGRWGGAREQPVQGTYRDGTVTMLFRARKGAPRVEVRAAARENGRRIVGSFRSPSRRVRSGFVSLEKLPESD